MLETVLRLDQPNEMHTERQVAALFLPCETEAPANFFAWTEEFWKDHVDVLPEGTGIIFQQATPSAHKIKEQPALISDQSFWSEYWRRPKGSGGMDRDIFPPARICEPPAATLLLDARRYNCDEYLWELTIASSGGRRLICQLTVGRMATGGEYFELDAQGRLELARGMDKGEIRDLVGVTHGVSMGREVEVQTEALRRRRALAKVALHDFTIHQKPLHNRVRRGQHLRTYPKSPKTFSALTQ